MSEIYEHSKWVVEEAKVHGRSDTCKFGDALIGVLAELRGQVKALEEFTTRRLKVVDDHLGAQNYEVGEVQEKLGRLRGADARIVEDLDRRVGQLERSLRALADRVLKVERKDVDSDGKCHSFLAED